MISEMLRRSDLSLATIAVENFTAAPIDSKDVDPRFYGDSGLFTGPAKAAHPSTTKAE